MTDKIKGSLSGAKSIDPIDILRSDEGYKHFKNDRDVLDKAPVRPCGKDYDDGVRFNHALYQFDVENYYRNCANFLENYVLNYKAGG